MVAGQAGMWAGRRACARWRAGGWLGAGWDLATAARGEAPVVEAVDECTAELGGIVPVNLDLFCV